MWTKAGWIALLGGTIVILAGVNVEARAPNSPAVAAQRAYLCFEGSTADEVMAKANEAGARGWRMVTAASGHRSSIWCFEQFGASRSSSRSP